MSCGIPCISFDCPYGPSEIIQNGIDGILVKNGDINALAEKIEYLIENKAIRKEMGRKAITDIARYDPNIVMESWKNLFKLFKP